MSEISIITPGGYVVLRKFWLTRRKTWIGTIVANWRAWTFGFEIIDIGLVVACGPALFAVAAVNRHTPPQKGPTDVE